MGDIARFYSSLKISVPRSLLPHNQSWITSFSHEIGRECDFYAIENKFIYFVANLVTAIELEIIWQKVSYKWIDKKIK